MNGISLIPDVASSAQLGIARGIAGLNADSQAVAQSVAGSLSDLTGALVDSLQQKLLVEASARVLERSDQLLGTLIDVIA
jgi:hypothetical protein